MAKKLNKISVDTWIKYSQRSDTGAGLGDARDPRLKSMFVRLRPESDSEVTWGEFLTALHAVYAWMPTMLWRRGCPLYSDHYSSAWIKGRRDDVDRILKQYKTELPPAEVVDRLVKVTNNSVVGLSKLLYLFDPVHFPIWDSRVAYNYLRPRRKRNVATNIGWYLDWVRDSREWSRDERVINRIKQLKRRHGRIRRLSNLRVVELVLFHAFNRRS